MKLSFVCYGHPEPQGSTRAFIPKGWKRPIITSDNKNLKPWRQEVSRAAIEAARGEIIPRGTAVKIEMRFFLAKPASTPKKVLFPTKKPDLSKLLRAAEDSLTGILFEDDSQICSATISKAFELPERVEITVEAMELLTLRSAAERPLFAEAR